MAWAFPWPCAPHQKYGASTQDAGCPERFQGQTRLAGPTTDPDVVPDLGPAAQQGLTCRHFPATVTNGQRPGGRVSADEFAVVLVSQRQQALRNSDNQDSSTRGKVNASVKASGRARKP